MKFSFVPEYRFETFDLASSEFLLSKGIRGIILDVDNTLEPYEHELPGEHVKAWLESLKAVGIQAAIVSNNNRSRIKRFNEHLGLVAYYKAGKPFKRNLVRAMKDMQTDKSSTILMGDQVFTDVWAAHNAGIPAILVPPINDKRDFITRLKRKLEIPVLKKYEKIHKSESIE